MFASFCWSQGDIKIVHYLKKSTECSLLFPGSSFSSNGLKIPMADSVYSNAEITVKKVRLVELQFSNYKIFAENDTVRAVSFILKSKKEKALFDTYFISLGIEPSSKEGECLTKVISVNSHKILLTKSILGKKWAIKLVEKPIKKI